MVSRPAGFHPKPLACRFMPRVGLSIFRHVPLGMTVIPRLSVDNDAAQSTMAWTTRLTAVPSLAAVSSTRELRLRPDASLRGLPHSDKEARPVLTLSAQLAGNERTALSEHVEIDGLVVRRAVLPAAIRDANSVEREGSHGDVARAALRTRLPVVGPSLR